MKESLEDRAAAAALAEVLEPHVTELQLRFHPEARVGE